MKNNQSITVSAPGKLLLMGEHAVVYGYPSIVTAISQRLFVTTTETNSMPPDRRFVDAAVKAWGQGKSFAFSTRSTFSGKYGFGSSSAVTVATLKAIRPDATHQELFDAAYKIVLDIQGKASGFDVAAAVWGGTLYYQKTKPTIEPLTVSEMPFIVGYSGVKADTTSLVSDVAKKREHEPQKIDRIFQAIAELVEKGKEKMLEGDWERVGRLWDFNQEYLRDLGVSSEKLESLISAAKGAGAWGAKLSGAGGGDCMIALSSAEHRQAVEEAIAGAGGEVVDITAGAEGVRVETTDNQNELFVVVDENDTVIGYKTRFECHHNKTLIHRAVYAVLFDDKKRVLLQKRSQTKDTFPGYWSVSCSGHVAKGESYEQAVHRELEEELGFDTPMKFHSAYLYSDQNETEMNGLFVGNVRSSIKQNEEEIEMVQFFEKNELVQKIHSGEVQLSDGAKLALQKVGIL